MGKLITSLPLLMQSDDYFKRYDEDYKNYAGAYVRTYSKSDGQLKFTKNSEIKKFTIIPGPNNLLNKNTLYKYSSSTLKSDEIDNQPFEKFGNSFRYDYNLIGKSQIATLLDVDLTQTGHMLKANHQYCLTVMVTRNSNSNATNCPAYSFAYGGNKNEDGTIAFYSFSNNTYPDAISSRPVYFRFTPQVDCYHIYYCPNINVEPKSIKYTLSIIGLTEGDEPCFFLPENLGYRPTIVTADEFLPLTSATGIGVSGRGYNYSQKTSVDTSTIIRSLDTLVKRNKDIYNLDWYD